MLNAVPTRAHNVWAGRTLPISKRMGWREQQADIKRILDEIERYIDSLKVGIFKYTVYLPRKSLEKILP